MINWAWDTPVWVEMGWDGQQYELRACYKVGDTLPEEEGEESMTLVNNKLNYTENNV
jgi:hypothetical protein